MTESALKAGYSEYTANVAGRAIEPMHQKRIKDALQHKGVTTDRIAAVLLRGLKATRPDPSGPGTVVDYKERREYSKLALEAMGEIKSGTTVAVQINLPTVAMDSTAWGEED